MTHPTQLELDIVHQPKAGWSVALKITVIICCTVVLVAGLFAWTMCATSRDMMDAMRRNREQQTAVEGLPAWIR